MPDDAKDNQKADTARSAAQIIAQAILNDKQESERKQP
jgi:hypothetical protein